MWLTSGLIRGGCLPAGRRSVKPPPVNQSIWYCGMLSYHLQGIMLEPLLKLVTQGIPFMIEDPVEAPPRGWFDGDRDVHIRNGAMFQNQFYATHDQHAGVCI